VKEVRVGKRPIGNKWVYSLKGGAKSVGFTDSTVVLEKARLVARGEVWFFLCSYIEMLCPCSILFSISLCRGFFTFFPFLMCRSARSVGR